MNFKQITFIFSILMIFSLSVIGQNKLLQAVFMDGISGAPPPRDIKKTENGDYIMLIEIGSADIVMKDVVVEPMEKPEMYTDSLDIGIGGNYLLVKISNNLDLVSWVQLNDIGNVIEMTYSHGKTFVNHETYHDNHYIMIDELPILRQNEQSVIMMFDEDLNYEGDILSIDDQNIEEMIADDEFIYGHISMKSNNNGDDNPMVIIGTDTLHNFTGYNSQEELSFPLQTAAFFKYNYKTLELDTMWKVGGYQSKVTVRDLEMDNEGNLVMCGLADARNIIFNGVDTTYNTDVFGFGWYVARFTNNGEFIMAQGQDDVFQYNFHSDIYTDDNKDLYVLSSFRSDSIIIKDQIFYNYLDSDLNDGDTRGLLLKYDHISGELLWVRAIEGLLNHGSYYSLAFKEDKCYVTGHVHNGNTVIFDGDEYMLDQGFLNFIQVLESSTGEDVGHFAQIGNGAIQGAYIDVNLENENINWFIRLDNQISLLDTEIGEEGEWRSYFLELDLDFITSTYDNLIETTDLFKVYPNPLGNDGQLSVELNEQNPISVKLYNGVSQKLIEINPDSYQPNLSIDLNSHPSGVYIIQVESKTHVQNEIIIKP